MVAYACFEPGVRPVPSITTVAGPRRRRISGSVCAAMTLPSLIAIASTNDGTPFVANLAFKYEVGLALDVLGR